MFICVDDACMGCAACVGKCPTNCISMAANQFGELHPEIDNNHCIECGMCVSVCPANNRPDYFFPFKCYASWLTDVEKRRECASGGLGTAFAEHAVMELDGIVYGVMFSECLNPITIAADTPERIERLKGSKYVQSYVDPQIYREIRDLLESGRFVVFFGTPCHIAALYNSLGCKFDNLLTVDLICHGVSPAAYLEEEVGRIIERRSLNGIDNVRFRGNDYRMNFALSLWSEGKMVYRDFENSYLLGFLEGITLRESCYICPFARPERISDITIGDFIGLGSIEPFDYDAVNVSSVLINTEKGALFYEETLKSRDDLVSITREYAERLEYGPSLRYPVPAHELRGSFLKAYKIDGYAQAAEEVIAPIARKRKVKRLVSYTYRIPRKLIRMAKSRLLHDAYR